MGQSIFGTLDVKATIEYGGLTSVPMVPGFIRELINTRLFAMSAQASPRHPLARGKTWRRFPRI